jgi:large subunit ribosomal protein L24
MVRVASKQPRKQRKARYNAAINVRGKFLAAPLSSDLREKYSQRSVRLVTGDTVKVMRGDFAGHEGPVEDVDTKHATVLVHGVSVTKADGTEVPRPVNPSNVQIIKLNLKDSRRAARLEANA